MAVYPSPYSALRAQQESSGGSSEVKVYNEPKVAHRLPSGETAPVRPKAFVITNVSVV